MAAQHTHHSSGVNEYKRSPHDTGYHHKPTLVSNVDWGGHRRHDSSDSAWSSHSSSSSASSHPVSSPGNSTLQFQPLPHAHVNANRPSQKSIPAYPAPSSTPPTYHSPYGVLIADVDQPGSLSADPQRLAILRTLKAEGPHGTFSLEDPRAASSSRYECSYCQKRFNRPSSLRVCLIVFRPVHVLRAFTSTRFISTVTQVTNVSKAVKYFINHGLLRIIMLSI